MDEILVGLFKTVIYVIAGAVAGFSIVVGLFIWAGSLLRKL